MDLYTLMRRKQIVCSTTTVASANRSQGISLLIGRLWAYIHMIYTSRRQLHQRRGAHSHSGNYSRKSVWT
jgi:hypothetical protein